MSYDPLAFSPDLFPDTVVVVQPADGRDADGAPTIADGAMATLSASVQRTSSTSVLSHRREEHGGVQGEATYSVLTPTDPGITRPDVVIRWTAHDGITFATPIVLTSEGEAEEPGGLLARWTVAARRIS